MPVILGAFWRAELETAARQISGSRWCYAVPAALEGTDREDNTKLCLFRLNRSGHFGREGLSGA